MSPIIVDKENKKQEILQAAIKVFSRLGIPNTNMIDIAREAGIGKGTIYEYFRSKEEIINETFRKFTSSFNAVDLEALSLQQNSIDKLLFVIDGWIEILINASDEVRVLIEFWADSTRLRSSDRLDEITQLYRNLTDFLENIIQEGIDKHKIRKLDPKIFAALMASSLDGIILYWIINAEIFDIRNAIKMYKENLIRSLKAM